MERNSQSPWNPANPVTITPTEFELQVRDWLKAGVLSLDHYEITHQGIAEGQGGEYAIDVLARLTIFSGAQIVVLVECKHQGRPVERDKIAVLETKLRDIGAHKGMIFSTSGFQEGATKLATAQGIATITVLDGRWSYETRSAGPPIAPPDWIKFPRFAAERITAIDDRLQMHRIDDEQVVALSEFFETANS